MDVPYWVIPKKIRAFSLIELLAVVIIIGVIATLAIPQYTKAVERAKDKEAIANLKLIQAAERINFFETNSYILTRNVNNDLNLEISGTNWDYSVGRNPLNPICYAYRNGGPARFNRYWSIEVTNIGVEPSCNGFAGGQCP